MNFILIGIGGLWLIIALANNLKEQIDFIGVFLGPLFILVGIVLMKINSLKNGRQNKGNDSYYEYDVEINDKWKCCKCSTLNELFLPECKKCGKEVNLPNGKEQINDGQENMEIQTKNNEDDINEILAENGLEKYIEIFQRNNLNSCEIIRELDENDLEKLEITIMGDRKKILRIFRK